MGDVTRQEMSEEELIDDAECIRGLSASAATPPWQDKRSMIYSFTFPPQDFKMRIGDTPLRSGTLEPAGEIVSLDEQARRISLKLGPSRALLGRCRVVDPAGPIGEWSCATPFTATPAPWPRADGTIRGADGHPGRGGPAIRAS